MKIRPKIGPDCFNAANAAAGEKLSREDIEAAFQRAFEQKERLQKAGAIDNMGERLSSWAEKEAERTKIAAAMQKRHAAMNILVRDRLDRTIKGFTDAGMSPKKALLAVLEGTQRGVEGGRNSVHALMQAYESRFIGGMFAEIQANRPHVVSMLRDAKFDADILREMAELKEGGKPGVTGNGDAQYVAKVFATYAELSRTDLNRLGASIGKLDGWAGAQTHDDLKMIRAGREAWVQAILPRLDIARSFPDASSAAEIQDMLEGVYDTLITGFPNQTTPKEKGQRVNPANLAKRLGKSRVLHFKDADAALAYRDEFGHGTTVSGIVAHLRNSSRVAANMETFGPNPEAMMGSIVDRMKRKIKENDDIAPDVKQAQMKELDANQIRQAMDIALGLATRPANATAASIAEDVRAVQSMAKLGGAVISSMSDTVTVGVASMFRGSGFWKGFISQLDGIRRGRPKAEQAEIAYLLGEGFDGIIGHIVNPAAAVDGPVGRLARLQETFFRWNGLSWWTDVGRATAARMISAEMGMRAKSSYADLPANYRHVLGLHGIKEAQWEAIRKAEYREDGGNSYVTPDRIQALPDDVVEPLVRSRIRQSEADLITRHEAASARSEKEAEWVAGRKAKLDEWQAQADARLASMLAGNEIRTEVEKQLAARRIDLEKASIEEARTEIEVLSAAREANASDSVRKLLLDARDKSNVDRIQERTDAVITRLSGGDFRGGKELGVRYQRAKNNISRLRREIAQIERKSAKRDAAAIERVNEAFKSRLADLQEFIDKVYTREQQRADAMARDAARQPERIAELYNDGRRELEMAVRRFVADETSYGMIETDARSQRTTTLGYRPGTIGGEAVRFVMQFKGFPIAFSQRAIGRQLFGHAAGTSAMTKGAHIGTLLAGMTMAGYASMTMKDMVKGYWPPRDPTDPKTIAAAFVQGGAAGIYGDYLFGQVNRFGSGLLETAVGPSIGTAADAINLLLKSRDALAGKIMGDEAKAPYADALNLALGTTPFVNLFYTRPALDYLFLNSLRDVVSPGYIKRQEKRRKTDYGQQKAVEDLRPFN